MEGGIKKTSRVDAIIAGAVHFVYAAFAFAFWFAVLLLLFSLPSEGTRERIREMDRNIRAELTEIDRGYAAARDRSTTPADMAKVDAAYADALREPPHIDRMPLLDTMLSARVYVPSLVFTLVALMGNLLLFWSVIFVFRRRPESRKWLIRTALLKITGVALGLVMYVFSAGGAVLGMLRKMEAAHAAVYAERGLPLPEEFMLAPGVFFWVFVLFVAVMLVWPVLTILIQKRW